MSGSFVVVGVDGSSESLEAVRFAAQEASVRGLPLRVVHVTDAGESGAHINGSSPATGAAPRDAVAALLAAARQYAVDQVPELDVTTEVASGSPVAELIAAAADAAVLIVGRRRGMVARLRSTSLVAHVATAASCPVIVAEGVCEPRTNILVGVGDSESTQSALSLAFEEAALRGADVTAIHAWRSPALAAHGVAGGRGFSGELENNGDAARILAEALAGWRSSYPDVGIHRSVPEGSAVDALVQASTYAQMVVIGSPRSGFRPSIMTHELIRRAMCPVAIAPADQDGSPET
jgi:nucleotide-binding universal stress UspA family protein